MKWTRTKKQIARRVELTDLMCHHLASRKEIQELITILRAEFDWACEHQDMIALIAIAVISGAAWNELGRKRRR